MFHQLVVWLANTVCRWVYPGIVMLMALESSLFPCPSEVVIPQAAYLAATGKMNIGMVVLCGHNEKTIALSSCHGDRRGTAAP